MVYAPGVREQWIAECKAADRQIDLELAQPYKDTRIYSKRYREKKKAARLREQS